MSEPFPVDWANAHGTDPKSRRVLVETWHGVVGRLPADARFVLAEAQWDPPTLMPEAGEVSEADHANAWVGDAGIHVVVTLAAKGAKVLAWTLAHELAHCYLFRVGSVALLAAQLADESTGLSRAGQWKEQGLAPLLGDLPKELAHHKRMQERLADAVALAWGFGEECAAALDDRGELREDYLDPVLAAFR